MYINFSELKERVSMEQAISLLNLKVRREGSQWRAPCPYCKKSGDRALSMNVKQGLFRCFADGSAGGDTIGLVAHVRGTSQREAAEYLVQQFPEGTSNPRASKEEVDEEATPPEPREHNDEAFEDLCTEVERRFKELEDRVTVLEDAKVIKLRRP